MTKLQGAILKTIYCLEEDLISVLGHDCPQMELIRDRISFMTHDVMQLTDEELLED